MLLQCYTWAHKVLLQCCPPPYVSLYYFSAKHELIYYFSVICEFIKCYFNVTRELITCYFPATHDLMLLQCYTRASVLYVNSIVTSVLYVSSKVLLQCYMWEYNMLLQCYAWANNMLLMDKYLTANQTFIRIFDMQESESKVQYSTVQYSTHREGIWCGSGDIGPLFLKLSTRWWVITFTIRLASLPRGKGRRLPPNGRLRRSCSRSGRLVAQKTLFLLPEAQQRCFILTARSQ